MLQYCFLLLFWWNYFSCLIKRSLTFLSFRQTSLFIKKFKSLLRKSVAFDHHILSLFINFSVSFHNDSFLIETRIKDIFFCQRFLILIQLIKNILGTDNWVFNQCLICNPFLYHSLRDILTVLRLSEVLFKKTWPPQTRALWYIKLH